jgi:MFS family permease
MVYFGTIIFTPLFGWFADNKGKSASIMIFGSLLLIFVHLSLSLTRMTPYIPMFLLGIAFSLIPAAMWPSVAKIVDESRLGTAYGLMFSIQNLGLWAFPILIGVVLDRSNPGVTAELVAKGEAVYNYTNPILMLSALGIFGLVFAFLLRREDKTSGYGLEQPNRQD